jgi:hypothetical protein
MTAPERVPYPEGVRLRSLFLVAGLLLALGMFAASGLPTQVKFHLHTQGALHPWLHLLGFALLAALWSAAVPRPFPRLLGCAALLLFGYGTEVHESHLDGWPVEQRDVLIDAAGVLLGAALAAPRRASLAPAPGSGNPRTLETR